jgi:kinesin light chain
MSGMTQEEILQSTRTVVQGLDALKEEHEVIRQKLLTTADVLTNDERQLMEEKASIIDKNLDSIRLGIEEAQVMVVLLDRSEKK